MCMNSQTGFVAKVVLLSVIVSLLIRYVAPWLNIPSDTTVALLAISLPPLIVVFGLWWRSNKTGES